MLMRRLDILTLTLVGLGGINWALIALFRFNLFSYVIGKSWLVNILYLATGVAAVYLLIGWNSIVRRWKVKK